MLTKSAVVAAYVVIAAMLPSYASATCLTHDQARRIIHTSHLYWHSKDHCWDASPFAGRAGLSRPVRPSDSRTASAAAEPSNAPAKRAPTSSAASNTQREPQPATRLPELRQWSETFAMAETVETTPWVNRWPHQAIRPPSPTSATHAVSHIPLASPRGLMAGIMILFLSLAILEVLFGGTELRNRLIYGLLGARSNWTAAHRHGVGKRSRGVSNESVIREVAGAS